MTKKQDIHEKSDSNVVLDQVECQKVKFKVSCNKNWEKLIKYASCTSSW